MTVFRYRMIAGLTCIYFGAEESAVHARDDAHPRRAGADILVVYATPTTGHDPTFIGMVFSHRFPGVFDGLAVARSCDFPWSNGIDTSIAFSGRNNKARRKQSP